MPTVLTWNLYHGTYGAVPPPTIAGASPMDRLEHIATICHANVIDAICLQEVPQASLDPLVPFGVPAPATPVVATLNNVGGFLANYTVLQALAEDNPVAPQSTNTTDGYLILFRNAAFPNGSNNFGYFNPGAFVNAYGATLRPPVSVDLGLPGAAGDITVMNWHAQTGPGAATSVVILNGIGNAAAQPNPTAIAGDFNVRGDLHSVFGGAANFVNWTNTVGVYPVAGINVTGLDHVLTSTPGGPVLGAALNFTSDAYHYPIAANF